VSSANISNKTEWREYQSKLNEGVINNGAHENRCKRAGTVHDRFGVRSGSAAVPLHRARAPEHVGGCDRHRVDVCGSLLYSLSAARHILFDCNPVLTQHLIVRLIAGQLGQGRFLTFSLVPPMLRDNRE
jgi:hypothetical protein